MMQVGTSLEATLSTIVLATLAIGLPVVLGLAIRFLWHRSLHLGRSKELEKLIWQLHRIASAMEHQMNLSFPAVQPGTEEANDIAYLQRPAAGTEAHGLAAVVAPVAAPMVAVPQAAAPTAPAPLAATPAASAPAVKEAAEEQQQPSAAEQSTGESGFPPLVPRDASQPPRQGGVNSMFGF